MGLIAVDDGYGCVDREAMEIAERAVLGDALLDAFDIAVRVHATEAGYTVETEATCNPDNSSCRRWRVETGDDGRVLTDAMDVVQADCPFVHTAVLENARRVLGPWSQVDAAEVERARGWELSVGGGASPVGTASPRGWITMSSVPAPERRVAVALSARVAGSVAIDPLQRTSLACFPARSCDEPRSVWTAGGLIGPGLRVAVDGPLVVEADVLVGAEALGGGNFVEDSVAVLPRVDLELGPALDLGRAGRWTAGVQLAPIPVTVVPQEDPEPLALPWLRVGLEFALPLTVAGRTPPPRS